MAFKEDKFRLIKTFEYGYRSREDKTILPPQTLVEGSRDVLTNVSGRIGSRKGYTLDGQSNNNGLGIMSAYDYEMSNGDIRHLRGGFLSTALNDGKLQYRYVDSSGTVTWRDLATSQTSVTYNFTDFGVYSSGAFVQSLLLWVNGASSITEWTGGITTYASSTVNTITKQGTTTWAEEGFYTTGTHTVVIAGVEFQATGGWGTTTLTGVSPDPTIQGLAVGDVVHQKPETTLNSAMTDIPSTLSNDLIASLQGQVYVASTENNDVYVSNVTNYKSYAFTSPVRLVGEGALLTLDGSPRALIPQEDQMYISANTNQWYVTQFTLSSDLTKQELTVSRLKTAVLQGAQSQALVTKLDNDVVFLSNEPILNRLGRIDNVVLTPQLTDISFPIVNDMNSYDFTSGHVFNFRKYIYLTVPTEGIVRVYNLTNPKNPYWEAPLTMPISCFSIIDGELYGHSYTTSESYKLFDGYSDNGNFIKAVAKFAFDNQGIRYEDKDFNQYYIEGYISSNTNLELGLQYDLDGCATTITKTIEGSASYVCRVNSDASLGKVKLGSNPLGSSLTEIGTLPPKFRVIKTMPRVPYYEYQPTITSNGIDQQWEIIALGPASQISTQLNNSITD